jgi:DNA polymerase V
VDKAEGRTILAIDLKSFYASVECVDRGVDPFTTPLVVADLSRGKGTIILAVSPYLKTLGIPSRLRLYDLPEIKGMIYATPRMEHYIVRSLEVIKVYLKYVAEEDMHIYSVDEAFLDITHYLKAAGCTKKEYAKKIIDDVYKTTGLTVTAGIGPNLFMAKVAMDVEAKKRKDFMASWEMKDVPAKLWPLTPLSKMWGIGERMEKRLNALGMYTVGDIAVSDKWYLHNKFGQIGEEIWEHANGIDNALIQEKYTPESTSLAAGQTLFKDYGRDDALLIVRELTDELLRRLRKAHKLAGGLSLWCGYSDSGGFSKAMPLASYTDDISILKEAAGRLFEQGFDNTSTIRNVSIAAFDLKEADDIQLSLFSDEKEIQQRESLYKAIEGIRSLYGLKSILYASSLLDNSNAIRRADQIGGHRK